MPDVRTHGVTALLIEWRGGDSGAIEKQLPLVHRAGSRSGTLWRLTLTPAREREAADAMNALLKAAKPGRKGLRLQRRL